jgi:hypothetical protein
VNVIGEEAGGQYTDAALLAGGCEGAFDVAHRKLIDAPDALPCAPGDMGVHLKGAMQNPHLAGFN